MCHSDIGKRKHGKRQFKGKLQFRPTASVIYEKKRAHRIGQHRIEQQKERQHKRYARDRLVRKKDKLIRKAHYGFFLAHKNGGTRRQYGLSQKPHRSLGFFKKGKCGSQYRCKEHGLLPHGSE